MLLAETNEGVAACWGFVYSGQWACWPVFSELKARSFQWEAWGGNVIPQYADVGVLIILMARERKKPNQNPPKNNFHLMDFEDSQ